MNKYDYNLYCLSLVSADELYNTNNLYSGNQFHLKVVII